MDEALREARRQRILRNSEKRLQKILGVNSSTSSDQHEGDSETRSSSSAIMEENQFQHSQASLEAPGKPQTRSRFQNTDQVVHSDIVSHSPIYSKDQDIGMVWGDPKTNQITREESDTYFHSLLIFVAVSAVTILNFELGVLIGDNALIPFIGYEGFKMFLQRNASPQPGGLINTALLLSGIPQDKLTSTLKVVDAFKIVFHDLCIYIFVCLVCSQAYQTWK